MTEEPYGALQDPFIRRALEMLGVLWKTHPFIVTDISGMCALGILCLHMSIWGTLAANSFQWDALMQHTLTGHITYIDDSYGSKWALIGEDGHLLYFGVRMAMNRLL